MDISVWKKLSGAALVASLLLGAFTDTTLAKSKARRKAQQAAAQEQTEQQPQAEQRPAQQAAPAQPAASQPAPVIQAAGQHSAVPYGVMPTSNEQPAASTQYPASNSYPQYSGGEYYCDDSSSCPEMSFCDRLKMSSAEFKCWKMNHLPACCCCCGWGCGCRDKSGTAWQRLRNRWTFEHTATVPADINYTDTRDLQVYSAAGTGVPTSVPLAPVVRYAYNDGWGVPASRITTVGSTYNRWYPQEWYGFNQQRKPAPVGPDGRPVANQVPPQIFWPTDTTQHGEYYKHVPQWQPSQRTAWSNLPAVTGAPAQYHPTANLTPFTPTSQVRPYQAPPVPGT